jgi:hypothetical protein
LIIVFHCSCRIWGICSSSIHGICSSEIWGICSPGNGVFLLIPDWIGLLTLKWGYFANLRFRAFPRLENGGTDVYERFYSCRQCWASKCRGL